MQSFSTRSRQLSPKNNVSDDSKQHNVYTLDGIRIQFPYSAYDCQTQYMQHVITALQSHANALLESPTGTGKTLCLLCASLAWTTHTESVKRHSVQVNNVIGSENHNRPPLIIYASRTHSQLKQVLQQLRLTIYRPQLCVLGSRDHMCTHEDSDVMMGAELNQRCRNMVAQHSCQYKNKNEDFLRSHQSFASQMIDIEDIVDYGKREKICPYYLNVEASQNNADLILLPYNYLIDPSLRESLHLNTRLKNAIVIVDEAHNLESSCMDSSSFDFSATFMARCIDESDRAIQMCDQSDFILPPNIQAESASQLSEEVVMVKGLLLEMERKLAEITLNSTTKSLTKPGRHILYLLEQIGITKQNYSLLSSVLDSIIQCLLGDSLRGDVSLRVFKRCLDVVYRLDDVSFNVYRLHIHDSDNSSINVDSNQIHNTKKNKPNFFSSTRTASSGLTLSFWCQSSCETVRLLLNHGIHSLILTSGTLSPLKALELDLGASFAVQLENCHVISDSNVLCSIVRSGPTNTLLNSSYRNRNNTSYLHELGQTLINLARLIPDGLLVFFASYGALFNAQRVWSSPTQQGGVTTLSRLDHIKKVMIEPRGSGAEFKLVMTEYQAAIDSGIGAVMLAVCRGKVSEGFDFVDNAARGVVITGIPFPPLYAPKVQLKREFMDAEHGVGTGAMWYQQQAYRAVNQAMGRVIRHRDDFGVILLCDERFSCNIHNLSKWISCKMNRNSLLFSQVLSRLATFFNKHKKQHTNKCQITSSSSSSSSTTTHHLSTSMYNDVDRKQFNDSTLTHTNTIQTQAKQRKHSSHYHQQQQGINDDDDDDDDDDDVRNVNTHQATQCVSLTGAKVRKCARVDTRMSLHDALRSRVVATTDNVRSNCIQSKRALSSLRETCISTSIKRNHSYTQHTHFNENNSVYNSTSMCHITSLKNNINNGNETTNNTLCSRKHTSNEQQVKSSDTIALIKGVASPQQYNEFRTLLTELQSCRRSAVRRRQHHHQSLSHHTHSDAEHDDDDATTTTGGGAGDITAATAGGGGEDAHSSRSNDVILKRVEKGSSSSSSSSSSSFLTSRGRSSSYQTISSFIILSRMRTLLTQIDGKCCLNLCSRVASFLPQHRRFALTDKILTSVELRNAVKARHDESEYRLFKQAVMTLVELNGATNKPHNTNTNAHHHESHNETTHDSSSQLSPSAVYTTTQVCSVIIGILGRINQSYPVQFGAFITHPHMRVIFDEELDRVHKQLARTRHHQHHVSPNTALEKKHSQVHTNAIGKRKEKSSDSVSPMTNIVSSSHTHQTSSALYNNSHVTKGSNLRNNVHPHRVSRLASALTSHNESANKHNTHRHPLARDFGADPSCIVCRRNACHEPFRARTCLHVACYLCWMSHLDLHGTCPTCFVRVAKTALDKFYF